MLSRREDHAPIRGGREDTHTIVITSTPKRIHTHTGQDDDNDYEHADDVASSRSLFLFDSATGGGGSGGGDVNGAYDPQR